MQALVEHSESSEDVARNYDECDLEDSFCEAVSFQSVHRARGVSCDAPRDDAFKTRTTVDEMLSIGTGGGALISVVKSSGTPRGPYQSVEQGARKNGLVRD